MNIVYYQRPKTFSSYQLVSVILAILAISVVVVGALGTVFMRQEIMKKAERLKGFEITLDKLERRSHYLAAKIAQVHTPEYLVRRASADLKVPQKNQIVWVKPNGAASTAQIGTSDAFAHSLELALIETTHSPVNSINKLR